tara:strand:+ start:287 stop:601 length:315 start_codon:yes stop_codon:yes gene_type:complete
MVEIREAIQAINSEAEFSYQNEDVNTIQWNENTTPISKADIQAKQIELQAAYDALGYARARKQEYPNVDEFMEAYTEKEIGGNSSKWDEYVIKYNKVRSDNPKL